NSPASINYSIPIVACLVFSMHEGKLTGPLDGFASVDWDLQRMWASERAMIMRNQGFIHPATLVPDELEYNKGYEARMSKLKEKFTSDDSNNEQRNDQIKTRKNNSVT
ncbi:MAG TPA: fructose 1,6-bisphosphatase, partial [Nitrososphaeraceae archaeon]|nr:fructose 1,6-bisphosphatase [Nitrososphaeraceae archaeon]